MTLEEERIAVLEAELADSRKTADWQLMRTVMAKFVDQLSPEDKEEWDRVWGAVDEGFPIEAKKCP